MVTEVNKHVQVLPVIVAIALHFGNTLYKPVKINGNKELMIFKVSLHIVLKNRLH